MARKLSRHVVVADALLVVLVVTSASLAFSFWVRAKRYNADKAGCLQNMKGLASGLLTYAQDNDERLPATEWLEPGETCLVDERRTAAGVNIYRFRQDTLWNHVISAYIKNVELACPNDPTGAYKLFPPISYWPLVGPSSLVDTRTCEQQNGVMGKNWGATLGVVKQPAGTALITEFISSMSKDYQLSAGTINDHPWRIYASSSWCGVLQDTAVYPRREVLFNYDEANHFLGPHLGRLSMAFVDGHAANVPLLQATGGGADECVLSSHQSAFDRRHPLGERIQ